MTEVIFCLPRRPEVNSGHNRYNVYILHVQPIAPLSVYFDHIYICIFYYYIYIFYYFNLSLYLYILLIFYQVFNMLRNYSSIISSQSHIHVYASVCVPY